MTDFLRKVGKALRLLRVTRYRRGLGRRIGAAIEHQALAALQPRLVVDVGANKGQFSLLALQIFPDAKIIAFEPLPEPARRFRDLMRGERRVRLVEAGLGEIQGSAAMNVSGRDDCSSLLPLGQLAELHPEAGMVGSCAVTIGRLADFIGEDEMASPALLKIDVQGFERQVLSGCGDWLRRFTWIYVECSFVELYRGQALADEIIALLAAAGFGLSGIYCLSLDPKGAPLQADILFTLRA